MKALIGYDGSACAGVAIDLVESLSWPAGSTLRVVTAIDPSRFETIYFPIGPQNVEELLEKQMRAEGDRASAIAHRLERKDLTVEYDVVAGRPSSVLADEAARISADLIVVGSRGRGGLMTTLLGSVSAETIDQATVPVLVARCATIERVLAADDGSDAAAHAIDVLRRWPVLEGTTVDVLSVVPETEPLWEEKRPIDAGAPIDDSDHTAPARFHHYEIAERTVRRLRGTSHRAQWIVQDGNPAKEIVDTASVQRTDLILMGTHGYSGIDRFVLGSVSRSVLTHAHCSVLVVPPPRVA
jgi:nucleotide-binding universal stress UspA family protein